MDVESGSITSHARISSWKTFLTLTYQSFGVVYGDLSTSPLYVYTCTSSGIAKLSDDDTEIFGVLSLMFWTFTLIPLVKYVLIVLRADDNGEGGTIALYSLLCRHAKLSLFPNHQAADEELSTYKLEPPDDVHSNSAMTVFFERHQNLHTLLLVLVLLGTSMVIGDGILTPAISVLSAVSGIRVEADNLNKHWVVLLACIILVGLFALQHLGTHRVGFMFAPIIIAWLSCISSIGVYNIAYWNPGIVKALSPYYIYNFLKNTGKSGWLSMGGIVLCITGSEAMFADLGHFSYLSIKLAFLSAIYPSLILSYMGQAAFLSKNRRSIKHSFYNSTPRPLFWPVFIVATCASIVGSQAVISAAFSIIKQCQSLGCFPRVKVVHTSKHIHGQIYIPEINWILMVLCLAVTVGFQDTTLIGNAYGLAVITVMLVTTFLTSLVMIIVWHKSLLVAIGFLLFFGSIECLYVSSCLIKVPQGGWAPLIFALSFMVVMYTWHYGVKKKYEFDMHNKVSLKWLLSLGPSLGILRVRGIGLIYTELVTGVPPMFSHFITNFPAFHKILVFVCIKSVPVAYVPVDERFLVGRIVPREHRMYRCIVRYGYKDVHKDDNDFENQLVLSIKNFIQTEGASMSTSSDSQILSDEKMMVVHPSTNLVLEESEADKGLLSPQLLFGKPNTSQVSQDAELSSSNVVRRKSVRFELPSSIDVDSAGREELTDLIEAKEAGIAYILGHSYVLAKTDSSLLKRLAINVVYRFLRENCRGTSVALNMPHACLIEVGMVYSV